MGLRAALVWLTDGFQQRTGIQIQGELPEGFPELPSVAETTIFHVAQEALTNVHRHAEASRITLRVSITSTEFQLEVSDDGKGFAKLVDCRQGIGILGMHERLAETRWQHPSMRGSLQRDSGSGACSET